MSLIAAWKLGPISNIGRYHLSVRWTAYAGYQKDVSLLPPSVDRIAEFTVQDPSAPQPGIFRLVKAPRLKGLAVGWYSVVGRTF